MVDFYGKLVGKFTDIPYMDASLVLEVLGLESICNGFGGYVLIGSTMVLAMLALYIAWYFFQAKHRFPA